MQWYRLWGKRLADLLLTTCALIILSPVILIIAIVVWFNHGSPVLFRQERPGLRGEIFPMLKFRSMTNEKDENGQLLPDEDRITTFGRLLRRTSLDELPELFNVLRGQMSLVGPRPLLSEYLEYYSPEQMRRHGVRPGITGWAQVNGRNLVSWEEKFAMDVWYVDNLSPGLDLQIIIQTIGQVLGQRGVDREGQISCGEPFRGHVKEQSHAQVDSD